MTCVADHWPRPRAVGMPCAFSPAAMARSGLANFDPATLAPLQQKDWHLAPALRSALRPIIPSLAAFYYVRIEGESGTCLAALAHDQNRRGKPW
jgi:hypothetical protein